mgnify:CR=1 FL=1
MGDMTKANKADVKYGVALLALLMTALFLVAQPVRAETSTNPLVTVGFWEEVEQSEDGLALVRAAIDAGWDVNVSSTRTPLHFAIDTEKLDLVPLFIEAGADVNAMDSWHEKYNFQPSKSSIIKGSGRPLHYVAEVGQWDTPVGWQQNAISTAFQSLIDAGADINAPNINGDTPLHVAFQEGTVEAVNFLIEAGADQTVENAQGYTPYDLMFKRTDDHKLFALFPKKNRDKFSSKLMKVIGSGHQK